MAKTKARATIANTPGVFRVISGEAAHADQEQEQFGVAVAAPAGNQAPMTAQEKAVRVQNAPSGTVRRQLFQGMTGSNRQAATIARKIATNQVQRAPQTKPKTTPRPARQTNPLDRPVTRREMLLRDVETKRQAWQAAEENFGNVFGRLQDLVPGLTTATIGAIFNEVAKSFGPAALRGPGDLLLAIRAAIAALGIKAIAIAAGIGANITLWWSNWTAWKAARAAEDAYNQAVEAAQQAGAL
jgi:hypothetical protein